MSALLDFQGRRPKKLVSANGLFKAGRDTMEIAEILGITEAQASRRVFVGRCKANKLAIGFEQNSERRPGRPRKMVAA